MKQIREVIENMQTCVKIKFQTHQFREIIMN